MATAGVDGGGAVFSRPSMDGDSVAFMQVPLCVRVCVRARVCVCVPVRFLWVVGVGYVYRCMPRSALGLAALGLALLKSARGAYCSDRNVCRGGIGLLHRTGGLKNT